MLQTEQLICIQCPLGCALTATLQDGTLQSVTGNTCKRGEEYAKKELTNPTRTLTTSLPLEGGGMVPVKTASDIPKGKIFDCVHAMQGVTAKRPVQIGDVLIKNLAGTGVDLIATKNVE